MNTCELQYFNSYIEYLLQFKNNVLSISERDTDEEFHFTINKLIIDDSGCHQCKTAYPALTLYGEIFLGTNNYEISQKYEANMSTYDFFSCKCESISPEAPEMLFKFYIDNNYSKWINAAISYNINKVNNSS